MCLSFITSLAGMKCAQGLFGTGCFAFFYTRDDDIHNVLKGLLTLPELFVNVLVPEHGSTKTLASRKSAPFALLCVRTDECNGEGRSPLNSFCNGLPESLDWGKVR